MESYFGVRSGVVRLGTARLGEARQGKGFNFNVRGGSDV